MGAWNSAGAGRSYELESVRLSGHLVAAVGLGAMALAGSLSVMNLKEQNLQMNLSDHDSSSGPLAVQAIPAQETSWSGAGAGGRGNCRNLLTDDKRIHSKVGLGT